MTELTRADVKVLDRDAKGSGATGATRWHIQLGDDYYIVSAVNLFPLPGYRHSETMAFPADADGEVTDWSEVAFVPYKDPEACIANLLESLRSEAAPDA